MKNDFFTSDHHFFHQNILKFCSKTRQEIKDVDEMNEKLIENWNSQVGITDNVYHLGDFSFAPALVTLEVLTRLNGNIHLIKGNHDYWVNKDTAKCLTSIQDYKTYRDGTERAVLFHYPIYEWDRMHHGSYHLYGHVHGGAPVEGRAMDVGIDNRPNNDMMLWEWSEIREHLKNEPIRGHGILKTKHFKGEK